jgi:hypothetical protein
MVRFEKKKYWSKEDICVNEVLLAFQAFQTIKRKKKSILELHIDFKFNNVNT